MVYLSKKLTPRDFRRFWMYLLAFTITGCSDSCNTGIDSSASIPPNELEVYIEPAILTDVLLNDMGCSFLDIDLFGDRSVELTIDQTWPDDGGGMQSAPTQTLSGPLQQTRNILGGEETTLRPFTIAHPAINAVYTLSGTIVMECHCCCEYFYRDPNVMPQLTCDQPDMGGDITIDFVQVIMPGIQSDGSTPRFTREVYLIRDGLTLQPCNNCGCTPNSEECQ